jgi:hypothetical protein
MDPSGVTAGSLYMWAKLEGSGSASVGAFLRHSIILARLQSVVRSGVHGDLQTVQLFDPPVRLV